MSVNRYNPETGKLERIAGGTVYADAPIGAIQAYGGAEAPRGWLLCDGSAVSRTVYSELFAKIGTAFGEGDGSTTFNIPDLRGEFLRGAGTNGHSEQGNGGNVGQHQDATVIGKSYWSHNNGNIYLTSDDSSFVNMDTLKTNADLLKMAAPAANPSGSNGVVFTLRPTNTSVNYIIKAENILVPHGFAEYIRLATAPDWSNAVQLTAAQLYAGYTCPGRGIIVATGVMPVVNDSDRVKLSVNAILVAAGQHNSSVTYSYGDATVPVDKDDIVKLNKTNLWENAEFTFVPYKVQ